MNVHISFRTFAIFALGIIALILLWNMSGIILTFFLAFILFAALKPFVDKLEDRGWKRGFAVLIVYLSLFVGVVVLFIFIANQSVLQVRSFVSEIDFNQEYLISQIARISPELSEQLDTVLIDLEKNLSDPAFLQSLGSNEYFQNLFSSLSVIGTQGFRLLGGVFGGLFSLFIVFFLSIYMIMPRQNFYISILNLFPKEIEDWIEPLMIKIQSGLGAWVGGMITLMLTIGVSTYFIILLPSIFIVDYKLVELAFLIALIAGVLEAIPNIGPLLTFGIIVVFAILVGSPFLVIVYIGISFFLLQQAEALFLVPAVMKKAVDIHPILSILAVLTGFELSGSPIGALLSIPIAGILQIIILDLLVRWKQSYK